MAPSFRYLRDPVFLGALALFVINTLVLRHLLPGSFFRHHCNDLFLIPCALPLLLRLHVALGLRPPRAHPTLPEIVGHLLLWSLLFEVAGPHLASHSTGDPLDVLCYWIGGLLAWGAWSGLGRRPLTPQTA
jgi:hypothetical protein